MGRFVEAADSNQLTMLPTCLDDCIAEDNPVRVVDAFVEELDLFALCFERAQPPATGRPSYLYGYLAVSSPSRGTGDST